MSKWLVCVLIAGGVLWFFRSGSGGEVDFPMRVITESEPAKLVPNEQQIRVILFTGTEWCPACQHRDRTVISNPAWREFAEKEIDFLVFDIPGDTGRMPEGTRQMVAQYGIRGYPTMLVLDRESEVLSKQVGSGPPVANYKEWIRRHAKYYQ